MSVNEFTDMNDVTAIDIAAWVWFFMNNEHSNILFVTRLDKNDRDERNAHCSNVSTEPK